MKKFLLAIWLLGSLSAFSQVVDSLENNVAEEQDTLWGEPVELPELVISRHKMDEQALREFLLLQKRVYKVYPYAKIAAERLTLLDRNMAKLRTDKERKQYFKIVEKYIENEFTDRLKQLSRKQGQILVKLISRQTGSTAFDLVKEYKSGWKAFWASNTARVFNINLRAKYEPFAVNEDYLIETILVRAFEAGQLVEQPAAKPVDYAALSEYWVERVAANKKKRTE
mgnify:CR=1 FL=1